MEKLEITGLGRGGGRRQGGEDQILEMQQPQGAQLVHSSHMVFMNSKKTEAFFCTLVILEVNKSRDIL